MMNHIMILVLTLALSLWISPANAQETYQYAYLIVTQSSEAQLVRVMPDKPMALSKTDMTSRFFDKRPPYKAYVSPDGQWVGFYLPSAVYAYAPSLFRLINIVSGEMRDLATGIVPYEHDNPLIKPAQVVGWSPDSQYVALNISETGDTELIVHSIKSNTTINLTNDEANQTELAWSHDSTRIVTLTESCTADPCTAQLDVYEVSKGIRENSIVLSPESLLYIPLCELSWSPGGNRISFMSTCDGTFIDAPKEIYVWDIEQGNITPVTDATLQFFRTPPRGIIIASYDTLWYDNQTLLISSMVQFNDNSPAAATTAHNLHDKTATILANFAVQDLTVNPVSGQLAFQSLETATFSRNFFISARPVKIASSLDTQLRGRNLNTAVAATTGCNLAWSPDGATLAYTVHEKDNCRGTVQDIVLVDAVTGQIQEHRIDMDSPSPVERIVPIGWVVS